jgi:hypothetical protein
VFPCPVERASLQWWENCAVINVDKKLMENASGFYKDNWPKSLIRPGHLAFMNTMAISLIGKKCSGQRVRRRKTAVRWNTGPLGYVL